VADIEITYDPITVSSGPVTVDVTGLNDIKVDAKLAVTQPIETKSSLTLSVPDTVKTDTKLTYSIPDPIKTQSSSAIDLQPVVVDQCLRLSLGPLPPTLVCLPNRQHLGLTLFGVEVIGVTLDGEARIVVEDLPKCPYVVSAPAPAPTAHHGFDELDAAVHEFAPQPASRTPFVVRLGG
jgi:hypothetical protein